MFEAGDDSEFVKSSVIWFHMTHLCINFTNEEVRVLIFTNDSKVNI
jgi:hypothetical protein